MNTNRACGCKGFNSCYLCEAEYGLSSREPALERIESIQSQRIFCPMCRHLHDPMDGRPHVCFQGLGGVFSGVELHSDFISVEEEHQLIGDLDQMTWDVSQSGRRKQNFGPKANFKRRKVKLGSFEGFPATTKFIQDRFKSVPSLEDYKTVEQCSIEYRPETGARIDPHIDDCWIWGERIVQLNLLSDSVLTLFPYTGDPYKYNLSDVNSYPQVMNEAKGQVGFNPFRSPKDRHPSPPFNLGQEGACCDQDPCVVRIPLPRRSLLVFYGQPRYKWEHCILRRDIKSRRICLAYREFTPTYLPEGAEESKGSQILENAKIFF